MKRLTIFAAAVLSVVLIAAATVTTSSAIDEISFHETVLTGDKGASDGLAVSLSAQSMGYLFWDAVWNAGSDGAADTTFEYVRNGNAESDADNTDITNGVESGLSIDLAAPIDSYMTGILDLESYRYELPWELISEAAEQTQAGETFTMNVNLCDYYEYFPIRITMTYNEETDAEDPVWLYDPDEALTFELFNDYFRITVPDGLVVRAQVEKDEDGNVIDVGVEKMTLDVSPRSDYADAGGCGYLVFTCAEDDMDFSNVEGGFGIYRISYEMTELSTDEDGDSERYISVTGIETVYSLAGSGIEVLSISYIAQGDLIELLGIQDGNLTVTVINALTYELYQEITVTASSGGEEIRGFWESASVTVTELSGGLIALSQDAASGEIECLYVPLTDAEQTAYVDCAEYMSFLYSDGQLAYAYTDDNDENADFHLMIFDSEGIRYHARVSSDLDTGDGGKNAASSITGITLSGSLQ